MVYDRRNRARPFRNSGKAYTPKIKKLELDVQKRLARHVRKTYPHVIFHSDFGANLDMTEWQAKTNKALQSDDKFPDFTIFAPSRRINPKTGRPYIGLALELKKDGETVILKIGKNKGKLTSDPHIRAQAKTLRKLNEQGWYANFGIGYEPSKKIVDWFFDNLNAPLF